VNVKLDLFTPTATASLMCYRSEEYEGWVGGGGRMLNWYMETL
jgi:hypothetical protein